LRHDRPLLRSLDDRERSTKQHFSQDKGIVDPD
jgi:hypothetical protein